MKEVFKILELDKYELGIIINALNEMRNRLIAEQRETDPVDEVLLKALDAPEKKDTFTEIVLPKVDEEQKSKF